MCRHNHDHIRGANLIRPAKMTLNQQGEEEEQQQQQVVLIGSIRESTSGVGYEPIGSGTGSDTSDIRQRKDCARRRRVWQSAAVVSKSSKKACAPLTILLPFVILFLLPTFTLEPRRTDEQPNEFRGLLVLAKDLLVELIRLPFDRLRVRTGSSIIAGVSAKEINSKLDLQEEETHMRIMAPEHRGMGYPAAGNSIGHLQTARSPLPDYANQPDPSEQGVGSVEGGPAMAGGGGVDGQSQSLSTAGSALETRNDLPAVRALNVKCEKNHMTVNIVFDRPFYGLVFSKGHYNDQKCVHLPANSGQTSVNFDIHLGKCGMSSSEAGANQALQQPGQSGSGQQQPNGLYIENTIIIQYDPQVQEIYDQARKLRCTWYDYYEKSVTFRPYNVDMMDAVTANFLGDNIQCWMQIQVGKGPWASEVSGIVKIGQTMTMVLAIKDDENRFDMLVRNCVANDGKHQPIQLVDEYGCVARPKIMGKFQKVRNFGPAATVVSYAHFQAFKFPDSMSVHFQCVIQVCRFECPVPQCTGSEQPGAMVTGASGEIAGAAGDYAASGTEIVSSKEPLPVHQPAGYFAGSTTAYQNRSAVNLKLDESQGRVQVKLDTSMMTGSRGLHPQQQTGPLPPHLLQQVAGSNEPTYAAPGGSRSYLAASSGAPPYYRQPVSTGGAGRPVSGSRQQTPSSGLAAHFSAPYPSSLHRSTSVYANRIGELNEDASELIASGGALTTESSPLTLIALPRALRTAAPNVNTTLAANFRLPLPANHRARRSVQSNSPGFDRNHRSPPDSTAIQTQRTIQVVSPDDVAFSLLSPGEEPPVFGSSFHRKPRPGSFDPSNVCFSVGKLAVGALVTLLALASSMVVVVYFVLRQRAKLDEKLTTCYFDPQSASVDSIGRVEASTGRRVFSPSGLPEDELASHRRQQTEIQQRNKYLERLYSQFMPAAYWQASR